MAARRAALGTLTQNPTSFFHGSIRALFGGAPGRKRHEADMLARPSRMLNCRALVAHAVQRAHCRSLSLDFLPRCALGFMSIRRRLGSPLARIDCRKIGVGDLKQAPIITAGPCHCRLSDRPRSGWQSGGLPRRRPWSCLSAAACSARSSRSRRRGKHRVPRTARRGSQR
jgi:hypothetical protein